MTDVHLFRAQGVLQPQFDDVGPPGPTPQRRGPPTAHPHHRHVGAEVRRALFVDARRTAPGASWPASPTPRQRLPPRSVGPSVAHLLDTLRLAVASLGPGPAGEPRPSPARAHHGVALSAVRQRRLGAALRSAGAPGQVRPDVPHVFWCNPSCPYDPRTGMFCVGRAPVARLHRVVPHSGTFVVAPPLFSCCACRVMQLPSRVCPCSSRPYPRPTRRPTVHPSWH